MASGVTRSRSRREMGMGWDATLKIDDFGVSWWGDCESAGKGTVRTVRKGQRGLSPWRVLDLELVAGWDVFDGDFGDDGAQPGGVFVHAGFFAGEVGAEEHGFGEAGGDEVADVFGGVALAGFEDDDEVRFREEPHVLFEAVAALGYFGDLEVGVSD